MEELPGFEPGIAALQAAALPLGDSSKGGARSRTRTGTAAIAGGF